ncbi:conjugative transposon protein TraJ [Sphingobacterium phlebotomi]|uniref:Conjugative transposon protein TraJ n=1 Tax=Sphingobacterium phlebotomi TaxID=2605433 RepID=A0A5D4H9V0_9SPHI|nr:conjugative transposon protein TraJ [Sphingobacterium phlebotomi]TYR37408.1 conjugative transposon protein TraJ [Sphingobacterium phlebotomi]
MKRNSTKRTAVLATMLLVVCVVPQVACAQAGDYIYGFNRILDDLFEEMMPLGSRLIDTGRALAGFGALWYISIRVWRHIANAEPIDFFPLLRPFGIGIAILLFPHLIALMNGVLKPIEQGTRAMAIDSHHAIMHHIDQREKEIKETPSETIFPGENPDIEKYEESTPSGDNRLFSGLKNAFSWFSIKNAISLWFSEGLHILYAAASLCINVIRTFYLVVLAIIGPLSLGLSVFDGFENTLVNWFARYIHVYMWLPVANIFGAICSKILENMILQDQGFMSSTAYLVFMVIAIIGYTTVPTVAGYIVQPGGNDTLLHKVNNATRAAGKAAMMAAGKIL